MTWAFSPHDHINLWCKFNCIEITAKQAPWVSSQRLKTKHYKPFSFFLVSLHLWNNRNVLFSIRCNKGQPEGALKRRNDCLATYTTNTGTVEGQYGCTFFYFTLLIFFIIFFESEVVFLINSKHQSVSLVSCNIVFNLSWSFFVDKNGILYNIIIK